MKLKKVASVFMAVVLSVGLLAGCGKNAENDQKTDQGESTASSENAGADQKQDAQGEASNSGSNESSSGGGQEVTIWYYWETEGHQKALDKVISDYNASQSDITVSAKYVPFADFKKQLSIGASADELPDIAILDSPDHASYATNFCRFIRKV